MNKYAEIYMEGEFIRHGDQPYLVVHASTWADQICKPYEETEHVVCVSFRPSGGNFLHWVNKQHINKLPDCQSWEQAFNACRNSKHD